MLPTFLAPFIAGFKAGRNDDEATSRAPCNLRKMEDRLTN